MAKKEKITTIKVNPYEIAKASDIDYGFQSIVENAALITQLVVQAERDFVIGGSVAPGAGLSVIVKPFIAYCKDSGMLYCSASDITVHCTVASSVHNRIDVLTVSGDGWDVFQKELRAKWHVTPNPVPPQGTTNDSLVFEEFYKRQNQKIDIRVIRGDDNAGSANHAGLGVIKLAEVEIRAQREILDDTDIHYVEAPLDGEQNKKWTAEKSRTFCIAPMTTTLRRFFKIHNADGTLKDGVVGKNNLALSAGDAIGGSDLALGEDIQKRAERLNTGTGAYEPVVPIVGYAKLEFNILRTTKIKNVFDIIVDALIHVWKIFVESDTAVYEMCKVYTNNGMISLSTEFNKKIADEATAREAAIDAEKTAREAADAAESGARKAADDEEKAERVAADTAEAQARAAAVDAEAAARLDGDASTEKRAKQFVNKAAPIGSYVRLYDDAEHENFLRLDGSTFDPEMHGDFYEYWKAHMAIFGESLDGKPYLPTVERYDDSRIGEVVPFIGAGEYHHEFLEANGLPFSPDVYSEFYQNYWLVYLSGLGRDAQTGWPLRPLYTNAGAIPNTTLYIRALAHDAGECTVPFIKTGKELVS